MYYIYIIWIYYLPKSIHRQYTDISNIPKSQYTMSEIDPRLLQSLDEASKQEVSKFIEQETSKAKVNATITNFTDLCFKKCVNGINSGALSNNEDRCMNDCVNRFLDTNIQIVEMLQSMQR